MALTDAIVRGQLEEVKLLLDQGADDHLQSNQPILEAAGAGNVEIAKLLIARGSVVDGLKDALENRNLEMAEFLISEGGLSVNDDPETMLNAAFGSMDKALIKFVLKNLHPDFRHAKDTAFIELCRGDFGSTDYVGVETLFDDDVDLNACLSATRMHGFPDSVKMTMFLISRGADVLSVGDTIFPVLCTRRSLVFVKMLLSAGVDMRKRNYAALHYARGAKRGEVIKLLEDWKLIKYDLLTTDKLSRIGEIAQTPEGRYILQDALIPTCSKQLGVLSLREILINGIISEDLQRLITIFLYVPNISLGGQEQWLRNYLHQISRMLSTQLFSVLVQIIFSYI